MSPLRILQGSIRSEFPDLQMQVRRHQITYTWSRHLILRLTRMVRYTIIEPERYGFFNDEYVVVQIFPPLDHMTPVRQGIPSPSTGGYNPSANIRILNGICRGPIKGSS